MSHEASSKGYLTDTRYPETFFRELSPVWLNYVAVLNGVAPPALDRPFAYLELGCGAGHSTLVHAGAFPHGEFHACDIDGEYIAAAERAATSFDIRNVHFHAAAFDDLLTRELPDFDFIVAHGIYSWVGAEARSALRNVVRSKLTPGGLAYLSYNCLPGWSSELPLRRLLLELAATTGGDSSVRTEHALQSLERLSASKLRFFTDNPSALAAVEAYLRSPSNYLAHEFLNPAWELFYSIDVADEMAAAELTFAGSATLADNHPALVMDPAAGEAIAKLETPRQQQLAADFAANRSFRRDVFVRGEARLQEAEMARQLNAVVIGRLGDVQEMGAKAKVPRGEIGFHEDFIRALRALMSQGSMTIAAARSALEGEGRDPLETVRNLLYLIAAGTLTPFAKAVRVTESAAIRRFASSTVERMFSYVAERGVARTLPSDVVGTGVEIRPMEAMAVIEFLAGADSIETLAARLAQRDDLQGTDPQAVAANAIDGLVPRLRRLGLLL